MRTAAGVAIWALCSAAFPALAAEPAETQAFAVHGQLTNIWQYNPAFTSPYEGPQSFKRGDHLYSTVDATLYLGARLWPGAEGWINLEADQGVAPSNTLGAAGYVNGDGAKVGKRHPYARPQRVFIRQTVDLGGGADDVEADQNQLAKPRTADRLVVTLGKLSVGDVFDTNAYAHDPRQDFLNWSAISAGSFDYAADAWGYSYGGAVEWYRGPWTLRAGLFDLSVVPNNKTLDCCFGQVQFDAEVERRFRVAGREATLKATAFMTRGRMGAFLDAVALAETTGRPADTALVRRYRSRPGASVNLQLPLAADLAVFGRAGLDDGRYESYEYTDIDRTLQLGVSLTGARWGRKDDVLAVSGMINGISERHQAYQDAGGLGILIGDGKLPHPGSEEIVEAYYSLALARFAHLTTDLQVVRNPAYNRDRGPIAVIGERLHLQY
jgi:high affinity Mn2+ porin